MTEGYDRLTEKEKATLRLMARGHDAKSAAQALSLSIHTINERLRAARRKLAVTSSREAARRVLEHEGEGHENSVSRDLGDAPAAGEGEIEPAAPGRPVRRALLVGVLAMITLAFAAALALSSPPAGDAAPSAATLSARDAEIEQAARSWLELGDAADWEASFAAAGDSFRAANTLAGWSAAARQARVPLGPVVSRTLATVRFLNAPPHGYQEVTFHTRFAHRADAVETVTLVKEADRWKVVGILID